MSNSIRVRGQAILAGEGLVQIFKILIIQIIIVKMWTQTQTKLLSMEGCKQIMQIIRITNLTITIILWRVSMSSLKELWGSCKRATLRELIKTQYKKSNKILCFRLAVSELISSLIRSFTKATSKQWIGLMVLTGGVVQQSLTEVWTTSKTIK